MNKGNQAAAAAIRLCECLQKVREDLTPQSKPPLDPFAKSLYAVTYAVEAAITNGQLPQFAMHCGEFVEAATKVDDDPQNN